MPLYEPDQIQEYEDATIIVFDNEENLEDLQSYGISGNVSSPAISGRLSTNTSSPIVSGGLSTNSSSPAVIQNLSDNVSSPTVLNDFNEGQYTEEEDTYGTDMYSEIDIVNEDTLEIAIGDLTGSRYYEETEEDQIGEIRLGLNEEDEWVVQSIVTPKTDLGREEAERFAQEIIKQLEAASA